MLQELRRRARDAGWWLKHRVVPEHQYHVVRTDLTPGFHDTDTVLLHAAMAVLDRYIVGCGGALNVQDVIELARQEVREHAAQDWAAALERQTHDKEDLLAIHLWWHLERPMNHRMLEEMGAAIWNREVGYAPYVQVDEMVVNGETHPIWALADLSQEEVQQRQAYWDYELQLRDEDQDMLHRLVGLRLSMF